MEQWRLSWKSAPIGMRRVRLGLALMCTLAANLPARAQATEPTQHEGYLLGAVFAQGRVWMLSNAGFLSSIEPHGDKRPREGLPERALDLCVSNGQPAVITAGNGTWNFRRRHDESWTIVATVSDDGDDIKAMHCGNEATLVLTSTRLIELDTKGVARIAKLSGEPLDVHHVSDMYDEGKSLLLAIDDGEFGGGIRRVDKFTGAVTMLPRVSKDWKLDPRSLALIPVHGFTMEPWNSRCVALAAGLAHMFMEQGRIVEVCGDTLRTIYEKPYSTTLSIRKLESNLDRTVAFYGVTESDGTLWAIGKDDIYRIDASGKATPYAPPAYTNVDGVDVSFDNPAFVLLVAVFDQGPLTNRALPMLVPR